MATTVNPFVYAARVVLFGSLPLGLAGLALTATADDPPTWWWVAGVASTLIGAWFLYSWVSFRRKYPTKEAQEAARQKLIDDHPVEYEILTGKRDGRGVLREPANGGTAESAFPNRLRIARDAVKSSDAVLHSGREGTAVVTFLADMKRGNEYSQLVYLELDVTVEGGDTYQARTGEYLTLANAGSVAPGRRLAVKVDPKDSARVAVDWERSLRLATNPSPPEPPSPTPRSPA